LHTLTALPSNQQVLGLDTTAFVKETIGGGAITAYDKSGAPVNVQLRWGKIDSSTLGSGPYGRLELVLSGQQHRHRDASRVAERGRELQVRPERQMNPLIANTTLNNVKVDGISLGRCKSSTALAA